MIYFYMDYEIEIINISKKYKEIHAVNDLSFKVKKGELFGFLGINGAGKSTTISMICSQIKPDAGEIKIKGESIFHSRKYLNKIGVVFQDSHLDPLLTVNDNLKSRAACYNIVGTEYNKRIEELSELLQIKDLLNRIYYKLSGGQKRRIDIARALIHKPEILILDEPTTGLDPQTRKLIWEVIFKLKEEQHITILLTTHYMEEAANSDYIVIIDKGKKIVEGTPLELKNKYATDYILLYHVDKKHIDKLGVEYSPIKDGYKIKVKDTSLVTDLIKKHPEIFTDYEVYKGRMDEVFLNVTGKELIQ